MKERMSYSSSYKRNGRNSRFHNPKSTAFSSLYLFLVLLTCEFWSSWSQHEEECGCGCPEDDIPEWEELFPMGDENPEQCEYIPCKNEDEECDFWAEEGECELNPDYMLTHCSKACGTCLEYVAGTDQYGELQQYYSREADFVLEHKEKMHRYMTEEVFVDDEKFGNVRDRCLNRHTDCMKWAAANECVNNPNYMKMHCAPACFTCDWLDIKVRCPWDRSLPKFLQNPGDLSKFFLNLIDSGLERNFTPTILSAPASYLDSHPNTTNPRIQIAENVIHDGPWVVTLDDVLSEAECNRLIELGAQLGYARSLDVGEMQFDGTYGSYLNQFRTSTNAWCTDECYNDEQVQAAHVRIEQLTGIPTNNSEYWQLLKYEETQEYMQHHDLIEHQIDREPGVRILTIFLYLNNVEAGGGTHFNNLNITVTPKLGQVLIWPSVLDENPDARDPRTHHQALPVEKGIKYGANAWVHQRDFKTSHHSGCA